MRPIRICQCQCRLQSPVSGVLHPNRTEQKRHNSTRNMAFQTHALISAQSTHVELREEYQYASTKGKEWRRDLKTWQSGLDAEPSRCQVDWLLIRSETRPRFLRSTRRLRLQYMQFYLRNWSSRARILSCGLSDNEIKRKKVRINTIARSAPHPLVISSAIPMPGRPARASSCRALRITSGPLRRNIRFPNIE